MKKHPLLKFDNFKQNYGKVFTFWFGAKPVVMIFDYNIGVEAFKKTEGVGRINKFYHLFNCGQYFGFPNEDYNTNVCYLRKISIDSIRYG